MRSIMPVLRRVALPLRTHNKHPLPTSLSAGYQDVHRTGSTSVYPLDYGYLAGTSSGDGEGIDLFVGTATNVGVTGVLLTADVVKRDTEIKLLLDCTEAEVDLIRSFLVNVLEIGGHLVRREDLA
nr:inorganic pyrophosphatase [Gordonia araii]